MAQPIINKGITANRYLVEKKFMDAKSIKPIVIIINAKNLIWWLFINLFLKKLKLTTDTNNDIM
jgi:hypothetical protein